MPARLLVPPLCLIVTTLLGAADLRIPRFVPVLSVNLAPGGGHMQHTIEREGYDLARWFAARGFAAFVLKSTR